MEKYGTDTESPDANKTAGEQDRCPGCGQTLDRTTNPPKCRGCGYEYLQQKRE